jgi:hypothetical protein
MLPKSLRTTIAPWTLYEQVVCFVTVVIFHYLLLLIFVVSGKGYKFNRSVRMYPISIAAEQTD